MPRGQPDGLTRAQLFRRERRVIHGGPHLASLKLEAPREQNDVSAPVDMTSAVNRGG